MMIPIRMYDNSMLEYMFVQRFDDNKIDRFKYEEIFFYDVEHAFEFISLFDWEDNCSYYWRDLLQDLDEYSYAIFRMTDEQVKQRLAILFAESDIKAFKLIAERQDGDDFEYAEEVNESETSELAASDNRAIRKPKASAAPPKPDTDWIEYKLTELGEAVAGIKLKVQLPDGNTVVGRSNAQGIIRFDKIKSGNCKATTDWKEKSLDELYIFDRKIKGDIEEQQPACKHKKSPEKLGIVKVKSHRVKKGDTVEKIAKQYGLTVKELLKFNWKKDYSSTEDLYKRFEDNLGYQEGFDKFDEEETLFSGFEDPGEIFIPQEWNATHGTGATHTLELSELRPYYFHAKNTDGHLLPEAQYDIEFSDGRKTSGTLSKSGVGRLINPPIGKTSIKYKDHEDIKSRSIAAKLFRAIKEKDANDMVNSLGYRKDLLQSAIGHYDNYYQPLHGGSDFITELENTFKDEDQYIAIEALLLKRDIRLSTTQDAKFIDVKRRNELRKLYYKNSGNPSNEFAPHEGYRAEIIPTLGIAATNTEMSCHPKSNYHMYKSKGYDDNTEYQWFCVNDRAAVARYGAKPFINGDDEGRWGIGGWLDSKWSYPGQHTIFLRMKEKNGEVVYHECPQQIEHKETILDELLENSHSEQMPNPQIALRVMKGQLKALEAAEKTHPAPAAKQADYEKRKDILKKNATALEKRLEGTEGKEIIPIKAFFVRNGDMQGSTQNVIPLRVCLCKIEGKGNDHEWWIIDWTVPEDRKFTGCYEGTGDTKEEAINDAIDNWKSGCRYFTGAIGYEFPKEILNGKNSKFDTDGESTSDEFSKWLERVATVGAVIGVIGLCLIPVPGSRVISSLIWAKMFAAKAAAVGTLAAAGAGFVNIYSRNEEGFGNWRDDSFDALTIASSIFSLGWLRYGKHLIPGVKSSYKVGHKAGKYILIGQVSADGAQGVLVAEEFISEYQQIMDDTTLCPDERLNKLTTFITNVSLSASMMYLNLKGTKQDLVNLKSGKTNKTMKEFADREVTTEYKFEDKLEVHADTSVNKTHSTTVQEEPLRKTVKDQRSSTTVEPHGKEVAIAKSEDGPDAKPKNESTANTETEVISKAGQPKTASSATEKELHIELVKSNKMNKDTEGWDVVKFQKEDLVVREDSRWEEEVYVQFGDDVNGAKKIGDIHHRSEGPEFVIDNTQNEGTIFKGDGFSITDEVLEKGVKSYTEKVGHPPEIMQGEIAWKNLDNFQAEYIKQKVINPDISEDDAIREAISNISYGKSRAKLGYTEVGYHVSKRADVEYKMPDGSIKIEKRVPCHIEIWATKGE